MKIFFDESGNSGTHLLDLEQPFFCLGSTNIEEEEASEIINRHFPGRQGPEIKSGSILRRPQGQRQFISFASEIARRPNSFCAARIGKHYAIIAKMVDNFMEPQLTARGYDFYANGYAAKVANLATYAFKYHISTVATRIILEAYNNFARNPNTQNLASVCAVLEQELAKTPEGTTSWVLQGLAKGAKEFCNYHNIDSWCDNNDLHITAALKCMGHWQEIHKGQFDVIHDESNHFFRRSASWSQITDPSVPSTVISVGGATMNLPFNVASTSAAKSHESASLQICDLIAGFASRSFPRSPNEAFAKFVDASLDGGFKEMPVALVDAGLEFPNGSPARASGLDAVDQFAAAVYARAGFVTPSKSDG